MLDKRDKRKIMKVFQSKKRKDIKEKRKKDYESVLNAKKRKLIKVRQEK